MWLPVESVGTAEPFLGMDSAERCARAPAARWIKETVEPAVAGGSVSSE